MKQTLMMGRVTGSGGQLKTSVSCDLCCATTHVKFFEDALMQGFVETVSGYHVCAKCIEEIKNAPEL